MKYIVLVFVLCFQQATAATYYVKASGGTGSGLDDANAWSYSKLNATALAAGDLVLFKRGDSFYGQLTPKSAGRPGSPIVYGPYGTGANPVISGFTQLGSWTLSSGHIYYAPLDVPTLNMVTLDGLVKGMGRYPNSGYLAYTSHSGNSSITGSSVATLPFDPATGEVVMRKNRWILDRHPVTSRSGSTLNYSTNTTYGNNAAYSPVDGNGYFVQNHLGSLDQEGEWFYDKLAKRLYMHFGAGTPTGKVVKASTVPQNLYIDYLTNLTFNNIDLEGGNVNGAYVIGTSNITFNQCTFRQQGGNGIWASFTSSVKINGGRISDALNSSIWFEQEATTTTIDGVTVTNSGLIAGAGRSGDHAQEGISIFGTATVIQNCSVINTGYNGINFSGGDNVLVEHNFVDTFCTIKDDGGGIYTYNSTGTNRKISNNIILNAIGTFAGVESNYWEAYGKAAGIYLDGGVSNTEVDHNVVAHGNWGGLFINGVKNHRLTNNLVYNFSQALLIHSYSGLLVRDLSVTGNSFIAKTASQSTLYLHLFTNDDPSLYGTFKNNIYARPIDDTNTIGIYREYAGGSGQTNISLATWKSTYSQDENSAKSLVTTDQLSNLRFDYNYTNKELIVPLCDTYLDITNKGNTSSIKLLPYSGSVLIKIPPASDVVQTVISGNWTDPTTWSSGNVPGIKDNVKINCGHTVTIKNREIILYKNLQIAIEGKLLFLDELTIYPNPAQTTIQVQHPTVFDSGFIQIISIDGREMQRQALIPGSTGTSINVHLLNPGFYLLHYQNGPFQNTARILKQ